MICSFMNCFVCMDWGVHTAVVWMSEDNFARFVLSFNHLRRLAKLVQAPSPFDSPNSSANSLICVTKYHLCCTFLRFWKMHNTYHVSTTIVKTEHFYYLSAVSMSPDAKVGCVVFWLPMWYLFDGHHFCLFNSVLTPSNYKPNFICLVSEDWTHFGCQCKQDVQVAQPHF